MTTKALQIRDYVAGLMTASTVAGLVGASAVYKDWTFLVKPDDLPAIAVYLGDEPPAQRVVLGQLDHTVQLKVSVMHKGTAATDATTAMDPILAEAHRRVVADLTLGGLAMDVTQEGISRRRDTLESPVLLTELHYMVLYRTANNSLEA